MSKTDAKGQDDPRFDLLEDLCFALDKAGLDSKCVRGWFARNPQGLNQAGVIEEIVRLATPAKGEPVEARGEGDFAAYKAHRDQAENDAKEHSYKLGYKAGWNDRESDFICAVDRIAPRPEPVEGLVAEARAIDVHDVMHRLNPLTVLRLITRLADALSASRERIEALEGAIRQACDLLAERTHGSPARSAGHNARLQLEAALKDKQHLPAPPEGEAERHG